MVLLSGMEITVGCPGLAVPVWRWQLLGTLPALGYFAIVGHGTAGALHDLGALVLPWHFGSAVRRGSRSDLGFTSRLPPPDALIPVERFTWVPFCLVTLLTNAEVTRIAFMAPCPARGRCRGSAAHAVAPCAMGESRCAGDGRRLVRADWSPS